MGNAKRLIAICLTLLILMINTALAEIPFLVYSNGWNLDSVPVDVLLKADVDAHIPFDEERLAMLTPITDELSMRLITGENEGLVSIAVMEEELLNLRYRENAVQISSVPDVTYTAEADPMSELLGTDVSAEGGYELLGLARQGETLLTHGLELLRKIPEVFEAQGKRAKSTTSISGYGRAAYTVDYAIAAGKTGEFREKLLEICHDGWLKDLISMLSFEGKQTIRMHFSAEDELIRAEYNGSCGEGKDQRKVKLTYKFRHDEEVEKDHIELTSPAKKGKNKNNLTFERTVQTNKRGARTVSGSFKYSKNIDGVASSWNSSFELYNDFTDVSDVLTGEFTLEKKLNGAEKADAIILKPNLTISGSYENPLIDGTLTIIEKYAGRVTEQADVSMHLQRAEEFEWKETEQKVSLYELDEPALKAVREHVSQSIATALIRPMILKLGKDSQWFFRDLPDEAVQSILDAAAAHLEKEE